MYLTDESAEDLLQQVLEVARAAGRRIVSESEQPLKVTTKSDQTPVCNADLAANEEIIAGLNAIDPSLPWISEESTAASFKERTDWADYWLIDPLDGTWGFVRGKDDFTVSIALIHSSAPVLGVIVAPKLGVAYFASKGFGAYKQIDTELPIPIHVRAANEEHITAACSGPPAAGSQLEQFLESLDAQQEVAAGAALKSCLVAEGKADVYARLGPTGEWDTAAAQIIVEEAGGHVTDTDMQNLRYNTRESLTNPHFVVFGDTRIDWTKHLPKESC